MGHDGSMGHVGSMGQDGSWVTMGQWVMGHVYDGSDGSWVTKSDPWSTLLYNTRPTLNLVLRHITSFPP